MNGRLLKSKDTIKPLPTRDEFQVSYIWEVVLYCTESKLGICERESKCGRGTQILRPGDVSGPGNDHLAVERHDD